MGKIIEYLHFIPYGHSIGAYEWDAFDWGSDLGEVSKIMLAIGTEMKIPDGCRLVFRVGNWEPQGGPGVSLCRASKTIWEIKLGCNQCDFADGMIYSHPSYPEIPKRSDFGKCRTYQLCDPNLMGMLDRDLEAASKTRSFWSWLRFFGRK